MNWLKSLPISYKGRLNEVKLINFSVDMEEVLPMVPEGIKVRSFDGRAIISMVNVKLRQMRPSFLPKSLSFNYQHLAFRLLVDDSEYNDGQCKGIYFLKSFTDKPVVVLGGGLFTNYNLTKAEIHDQEQFQLSQGNRFVRYQLKGEGEGKDPELKSAVKALDRAYAIERDQLMKTTIQREAWPIEWVACEGFETNFFSTARFLEAFELKAPIDYQWKPAVVV